MLPLSKLIFKNKLNSSFNGNFPFKMNANNEPNLIGCAERNSDGGGVLRLGRRQRRPGARLLLHRLR